MDRISSTDIEIQAPSSKAHTLRALIISSLAKGKSVIINPLLGEDQLNVIECLKRLGVEIKNERDRLIVLGRGGRYQPISSELDVGESGVGMNFLASAACLSDKAVVVTGAKRILERPIFEVVHGLGQLGAAIKYLGKEGFPPIRVDPGFEGGIAQMRGEKTSQYFSSIAICSPYSKKPVILKCIDQMRERPYFDISLQMMSDFGVKAENDNYEEIRIPNDKKYSARDMTIEGDYSNSSFFFLAAAICRTRVSVTGLNPNTKQGDRKFLGLIEKMGCKVIRTNDGICVEGRELSSIEADMGDIPDLVPPIAVAAAFAQGESTFRNIGHLRHKECDRLAVIVSQLGKMGVRAKCDEDSLAVEGSEQIHGASIYPHNDHRIAMSFAVAGLATGGQAIENETCVAKSFPDFWERFEVFY
ncbi:MAG: 3-phosphoshikimate 1-carboxyvinyltransferase [Planctomycetota bacterium]